MAFRGGLLAFAFTKRDSLRKPLRHPWWAIVLAPSSFWWGLILVGVGLGWPYSMTAIAVALAAWTTFYVQAAVAYGPRAMFRLRHVGDPAAWRGEAGEPVPRVRRSFRG
jgi:hypothetical protein